MWLPSLLAALGLAALHLFAGELRFLDRRPRSYWLSAAGGVSVAYVFVRLLPQLAAGQEAVRRVVSGPVAFVEHHVYLVALLGLATFYGVEALPKGSHAQQVAAGATDRAAAIVLAVRIGSYALVNGLVGYLLVRRENPSVVGLALFFAAMALLFLVNDHGLRRAHRVEYHRVGRWVLAGAVLVGWGVGLATPLTEVGLSVLVAFLSGGVILNVLKEELPTERQSRFWPFLAGAAGYAALLLAV
jgi:hypothetical protein